MHISTNNRILLEVPEVCVVLGLSKQQVYSISDQDMDKVKDPPAQNRNFYEAEKVFNFRKVLHNGNPEDMDSSFRKINETPINEKPKILSIINKMYRFDTYDTSSMGLKKFVHNSEGIGMESMEIPEEEAKRQIPMAKERCFGWADESCNECTKHCDLLPLCRKERNERLMNIAQSLEEEEEKDQGSQDLEEEGETLNRMSREAESLKEDIANTLSG